MKVKDAMNRGVEPVQLNDNVAKAARMMRKYTIEAVPVCDDGKVVGIVTASDITTRVVADELPLTETFVGKAMSTGVVACNEEDDDEDALGLMEHHGVLHLLVKNQLQRVSGIVSLPALVLRPSVTLGAAAPGDDVHRRGAV